jgi:hypothetical protein
MPALHTWFTPRIAEPDRFVTPDFELGQFFYTADTAKRLAKAMDSYRNPVCLCTPRLAFEWLKQGRSVTLLDRDKRFATHPGFRQFDLLAPVEIEADFDVLIFDPVFIPAEQLFRAVQAVLANSIRADLFMTFPVIRDRELLQAFREFPLRQLNFDLRTCNVRDEFQSLFRLYGTRELPA